MGVGASLMTPIRRIEHCWVCGRELDIDVDDHDHLENEFGDDNTARVVCIPCLEKESTY